MNADSNTLETAEDQHQDQATLVGLWCYEGGEYEISNRNGHLFFSESGVEGSLIEGPEWLEGNLKTGRMRIKLHDASGIRAVSNFKPKGEDSWLPDTFATKASLIGRWRYEGGEYEISNRDGHLFFFERGIEGLLVQGPEWLEGDLHTGRMRIKLQDASGLRTVSNFKPKDEESWLPETFATKVTTSSSFLDVSLFSQPLDAQVPYMCGDELSACCKDDRECCPSVEFESDARIQQPIFNPDRRKAELQDFLTSQYGGTESRYIEMFEEDLRSHLQIRNGHSGVGNSFANPFKSFASSLACIPVQEGVVDSGTKHKGPKAYGQPVTVPTRENSQRTLALERESTEESRAKKAAEEIRKAADERFRLAEEAEKVRRKEAAERFNELAEEASKRHEIWKKKEEQRRKDEEMKQNRKPEEKKTVNFSGAVSVQSTPAFAHEQGNNENNTCTFTIRLKKADRDARWGFQTFYSDDEKHICIRDTCGAPMQEWQESHPTKQVRFADEVVSCNGQSGGSRALFAVMRTSNEITLVLRRQLKINVTAKTPLGLFFKGTEAAEIKDIKEGGIRAYNESCLPFLAVGPGDVLVMVDGRDEGLREEVESVAENSILRLVFQRPSVE